MVFLRCVSKENLTISNGWSMINVEKEMIGKRRSSEKERAVMMKKFLEAKPAMLSFFVLLPQVLKFLNRCNIMDKMHKGRKWL